VSGGMASLPSRARSLLATAAVALLLLFGCSGEKLVPDGEAAMSVVQRCQLKCSTAQRGGMDMSPGPCLGSVGKDWVCDVAHSPRVPGDDLPENQCAAYLNGTARHFVEVSQDCQFIREA